mmetsp:Transcript_87782/g.243467  ORF Transcript_87782/g.243467 Transcript_87782/m.243467 type:complete len:516 (+) Transcript_87782:722-2269(+)
MRPQPLAPRPGRPASPPRLPLAAPWPGPRATALRWPRHLHTQPRTPRAAELVSAPQHCAYGGYGCPLLHYDFGGRSPAFAPACVAPSPDPPPRPQEAGLFAPLAPHLCGGSAACFRESPSPPPPAPPRPPPSQKQPMPWPLPPPSPPARSPSRSSALPPVARQRSLAAPRALEGSLAPLRPTSTAPAPPPASALPPQAAGLRHTLAPQLLVCFPQCFLQAPSPSWKPGPAPPSLEPSPHPSSPPRYNLLPAPVPPEAAGLLSPRAPRLLEHSDCPLQFLSSDPAPPKQSPRLPSPHTSLAPSPWPPPPAPAEARPCPHPAPRLLHDSAACPLLSPFAAPPTKLLLLRSPRASLVPSPWPPSPAPPPLSAAAAVCPPALAPATAAAPLPPGQGARLPPPPPPPSLRAAPLQPPAAVARLAPGAPGAEAAAPRLAAASPRPAGEAQLVLPSLPWAAPWCGCPSSRAPLAPGARPRSGAPVAAPRSAPPSLCPPPLRAPSCAAAPHPLCSPAPLGSVG